MLASISSFLRFFLLIHRCSKHLQGLPPPRDPPASFLTAVRPAVELTFPTAVRPAVVLNPIWCAAAPPVPLPGQGRLQPRRGLRGHVARRAIVGRRARFGVRGLARAAQASVGGAGQQTFSSRSRLWSVGTRGVS